MKCVERRFNVTKGPIKLYPIGDVHIGGLDVAEGKLRRLVEKIRKDPSAYWIGMGDMVEAINPKDQKRWDAYNIPDWLLKVADPDEIRENLSCVWEAQVNRLVGLLGPIKDKCLGLLAGNHEDKARKEYANNVQKHICTGLNAEDLTDCCLMRLTLKKDNNGVAVILFATHGAGGGGRTKGAEHNRMARVCNLTDADITLVSHTHQAAILAPEVKLTIPRRGDVNRLIEKVSYAANCGCWKNSYAKKATYESRALYQPRLIQAIECVIGVKHRRFQYETSILLRFVNDLEEKENAKKRKK